MKYWSSFWAMLKQQLLVLTRYPVNLTANFALVLVMVVVVTVLVTMFAPPEMAIGSKASPCMVCDLSLFFAHHLDGGAGLAARKGRRYPDRPLPDPGLSFFNPAGSRCGAAGLDDISRRRRPAGCSGRYRPLVLHNPWLALAILIFTVSGLIGLGFAIAAWPCILARALNC